MNAQIHAFRIIGWLFGLLVATIGILNLILVHPVPGVVYLLLSLLYFPPVEDELRSRFNVAIPRIAKIILGVVIIWFTLGISDLGDMID